MTKYKAIKTNGYASKKEAGRAVELKLMERAGLITELREQVVYVLAPSVVIQGRKRPALRYVADFVYWRLDSDKTKWPNGEWIVEDTKGFMTPVFKLKRHLMKAVLNIDILIT